MRRLAALALLLGLASCEEQCNKSTASRPGCCKVCTTGKPCGDTCIDDDKVCHQTTGCACAR